MQTVQREKLVKFSSFYRQQILLNTTKKKPVLITNDWKLLPNYSNEQLGWVCRQEWKMEKKTNIPLRFRLGSTEQVDYLEGKRTAEPNR